MLPMTGSNKTRLRDLHRDAVDRSKMSEDERAWAAAVVDAQTKLEAYIADGCEVEGGEVAAYIQLIAENMMIERLHIPPHWKSVGECRSCGPVALDHRPLGTLVACPWCHTGKFGRAQ